MQKIILFSALFIMFSSCNYKLLVNKNRVYNTRTGYLLFFHRQNFFFPVKHIEGNNFFTSKVKEGYLIDLDKEENVLYEVAEKYVIDYQDLYNGEKIFVRDTICVVPVEVGSMPYKYKGKRGSGDLVIKRDDRLKSLKYYNTNNEAVWAISPILKEDIKEASDYYNEKLISK